MSKALRLVQITVEHQDCQFFTVFLTRKTSSHSPRGPTPYPFYHERGTPFVHLLFTHLVLNFASLLTAVNTLSFK